MRENRCFRYEFQKATWLKEYEDKGELDSRAWKVLLERFLYEDYQPRQAPSDDKLLQALPIGDVPSAADIPTAAEDPIGRATETKETQTEQSSFAIIKYNESPFPFSFDCPANIEVFDAEQKVFCKSCCVDEESMTSKEETKPSEQLSTSESNVTYNDIYQHYIDLGYDEQKAKLKADYRTMFRIEHPRWELGDKHSSRWQLDALLKPIEDFPNFKDHKKMQASSEDSKGNDEEDTPLERPVDLQEEEADLIASSGVDTSNPADQEMEGESSFTYHRNFVPDDVDVEDHVVRDIIDDVISSFMNMQSKHENLEWSSEYIKTEVRLRLLMSDE